MIVANAVGGPDGAMGSDESAVTIFDRKGVVAQLPRLPKWEVAEHIWDAVQAARTTRD